MCRLKHSITNELAMTSRARVATRCRWTSAYECDQGVKTASWLQSQYPHVVSSQWIYPLVLDWCIAVVGNSIFPSTVPHYIHNEQQSFTVTLHNTAIS